MPQIDFDGANSLVKTDKIQGQSGTTVTVPTGHTVAITDSGGLTVGGRAVTPFLVGASGHKTAGNQAIATATLTKVLFEAESYDPNSDFDIATNEEYVAPAAGKYLIIGNVSFGGIADAKYMETHIYINGASKAYSRYVSGVTSASVIANVVCIKNLSASDTVQLWCKHDHGSNLNIYSAAEDRIFLHVQRIA